MEELRLGLELKLELSLELSETRLNMFLSNVHWGKYASSQNIVATLTEFF